MWTEPINYKKSNDVAKAMNDVTRATGYIPNNLQTDKEIKSCNCIFAKLINEYNIKHYSTFSTTKTAIVARAIRTLKTWIYKEFFIRWNISGLTNCS